MGGNSSKQNITGEHSNKYKSVIESSNGKSVRLTNFEKSPESKPKIENSVARPPDNAFENHVAMNQPETEVGDANHQNINTTVVRRLESTGTIVNRRPMEDGECIATFNPGNDAVLVPLSCLISNNPLNISTVPLANTDEQRSRSYIENLKDQMESIARWHAKKEHLFIETNAYRELKDILDAMHWGILLGKPGDGKSSTAGHALLEYERQGYEPMFITSPLDWKALVAAGSTAEEDDTKQIVVIDDMFGTSCVDQGKTGEWLSLIENMERVVEIRKGNLLVISTSRRYIFSDVESSMTKFKSFSKTHTVDMTDTRFQLSGDEKEKIFDAFANEYNVSDIKGSDVKYIDSPHGFPLCAEMFCTNSFLRTDGLAFFKNPVSCVRKEFLNFKDNDNNKYIVLLMMLLNKNQLPRSYFENLLDVGTDDEKRVFKTLGVSLDTATPGLVRARKALLGTYITTSPDGFYTFIHETLMENVADVYISASPFTAIELIEFQYIVGYLNNLIKSNEIFSEDLCESVCKRFAIELISGNVLSVCRCEVWESDAFIQSWISYLESDTKACDSSEILASKDTVESGWDIQYKIISDLRKIVYSPVTTYELTNAVSFSVINALIHCRRKRAVIAILSQDIKPYVKQESYWKESLQLGLEIACIQADNIEIVKALTQLKDEVCLNGSRALAIALAFTNYGYAEILLKDSIISVNYMDQSGRGHYHYLTDSKMPFDQFENIAKMLNDHESNINETDMTGEPLIFSLVERLMKQEHGIERCKILVKIGANIHIKDSAGRNIALYSLERLSFSESLKLLQGLEHKDIDFQCVDQHGNNVVHYFCNQIYDVSSEELFSFLTKVKKTSVIQADNTGRIPLMLAILNSFQNVSILKELLECSPVGHADKFGRGLFHYLCSSSRTYEQFCFSCNAFLEKGENVNFKDSEGISPLFECVRNVNLSFKHFQYLVLSGANMDEFDDCGRNIVLYTIFKRRLHCDVEEFLDFIYQKGINFHELDNCDRNALHYLFDRDETDAEHATDQFNRVYDFLTTVTKVSISQPDNENVTPIMLALEHCPDSALVRSIISSNEFDEKDNLGRNYFHFLVRSHISDGNFHETCSILLGKNIDINHKDNLGRSPLFECFVSQNAERMECLVKFGAKADPTESWNEPVVAKENVIRIKGLLERAGLKFDADTVCEDGYTVFLNIYSTDDEIGAE